MIDLTPCWCNQLPVATYDVYIRTTKPGQQVVLSVPTKSKKKQLLTLKMAASSSLRKSCFPACFHGMRNMVLASSSHTIPGYLPLLTCNSNNTQLTDCPGSRRTVLSDQLCIWFVKIGRPCCPDCLFIEFQKSSTGS